MIRITIFVISAALLCRVSLAEPYGPPPQYDPEASWCVSDAVPVLSERDFPADGAITQIGNHYFRTCRAGTSEILTGRMTMSLTFNPARVDELSSSKGLIGLIVNGRSTWHKQIELSKLKFEESGSISLGGLVYQRYIYRNSSTNNIQRTLLIFENFYGGAQVFPNHSISCGQYDQDLAVPRICHIIVEYKDIWANLLFLQPLPDDPQIPLDKAPLFAQDVVRILEVADVTEALLSGEISLPLSD